MASSGSSRRTPPRSRRSTGPRRPSFRRRSPKADFRVVGGGRRRAGVALAAVVGGRRRLLPRLAAGPAHPASPAFRRWAHAGRGLAEYSSVVAAAYFKASPNEHGLSRRATRSSSGPPSGSGCTKGTGSQSRSPRCTSAPVPACCRRSRSARWRASWRSSRRWPSARTSSPARASIRRRICSSRSRRPTVRPS